MWLLAAYLSVGFYDAIITFLNPPFPCMQSCVTYIFVRFFSMFYDFFLHLSMLWSLEFFRPIFFWVHTLSQSLQSPRLCLWICTYFLPVLPWCRFFSWDSVLGIKGNSAPFPDSTHIFAPNWIHHQKLEKPGFSFVFFLISVRHHRHCTEARAWIWLWTFILPLLPLFSFFVILSLSLFQIQLHKSYHNNQNIFYLI